MMLIFRCSTRNPFRAACAVLVADAVHSLRSAAEEALVVLNPHCTTLFLRFHDDGKMGVQTIYIQSLDYVFADIKEVSVAQELGHIGVAISERLPSDSS